MKVINRSNLKRRELVALKGVGKSSLVFRAGTSRYGYTNSRERGKDYQPEGYGDLEVALPNVLQKLADLESEIETLRNERDVLEAKISARKSQMRDIAISLPHPDVSELPKLEPIKDRSLQSGMGNVWQEMRDAGADYVPYGCTLFVLPNDEQKGEAA